MLLYIINFFNSIDDVFIVTSDKVDPPDSPFNYEEKKQIIKSHGIPEDRVYKVKSPYKAEEVLQQFNPATTAAIFVIGKKDLNRLGGTFFRPWKGKSEVGYRKGAYTLVAPHESLNIPGYGEMSGTTIRAALSKGDIGILKKIMGDDFDRETVAMIIKKLSRKDENVKTYKKYLTEVVNEVIFESNESSSLLSKLSLLSKPSLLSELSKPSKPKTFYDIALLHGDELEEEIEEEEELEELSGAAGSGGYAGQFPGKKHSLVREEVVSDASAPDAPYDITAMNILFTLFRDIMSNLETSYKSLTTSKDQRDSFRAHILSASADLMTTINSAPDKGKSIVAENVDIEEEITIDVLDNDEEEGYIDISDDTEASEEEEFGNKLSAQGLDNTGRNRAYDAFKDVSTQIGKMYASIDQDSIVPADKVPEIGSDTSEREVFRIYLLKNLGLYFNQFETDLETNPEAPVLPV